MEIVVLVLLFFVFLFVKGLPGTMREVQSVREGFAAKLVSNQSRNMEVYREKGKNAVDIKNVIKHYEQALIFGRFAKQLDPEEEGHVDDVAKEFKEELWSRINKEVTKYRYRKENDKALKLLGEMKLYFEDDHDEILELEKLITTVELAKEAPGIPTRRIISVKDING